MQEHFPALLERAIDWVSDWEATALESGRELDSAERIDARLAGVSQPARIRLLAVPEIPLPGDELLAAANAQANFLTPDGPAITLGYAVLVRREREKDRRLLVHEFAHVAQYERMGGIEGFLREYLAELITVGYDRAPLEAEATMRSNAIVGKPASPTQL